MRKYLAREWYKILLTAAMLTVLADGYHYIDMHSSAKNETIAVQGDGVEFAHAFLSVLSVDWSPQYFRSNAHSFLLSNIDNSDQDIAKDFAFLSQLGEMKADNCVMTNFASSTEAVDKFFVADFTCNAVYANNNANVLLQIKKDHTKSSWKVSNFSITPTNQL